MRKNCFSIRVVDTWNSLPNEVVLSTSINSFKSNKHLKNHPSKFTAQCYEPKYVTSLQEQTGGSLLS